METSGVFFKKPDRAGVCQLAGVGCVDAMRRRAIAQSGSHQALAQIALPCESCGSREEFKAVHSSPARL